jgi:hypothetical protein
MRLRIVISILLLLSFFVPVNSVQAAPTGCPNSWTLKVERKPGGSAASIQFENPEAIDYSELYFESTNQLEAAKRLYGPNIAYSYFQEWSADGIKWYDILANTVDKQGYFTNSFEVKPGVYLNFGSLFRFFNNGKWRYSLKVEVKDCPGVVAIFSSTPLNLPNVSIFENEKYDLATLYLKYPTSGTAFNFKQAEEAASQKDEWAKRMNLLLNSYGESGWREVDPNAPLLVVSSSGNPPCVNYVNRAWQPMEKDCTLDLFFVNKQKGLTEYYLVEKVLVNYFSRLKLKAEDEAKAVAAELKAKQEAKAATELKAKQEAEAKTAELKAKQDAEVAAAKAATELKAKQEAEAKAASMKKTTITCVKGKLTKKVTAVKPKCPTGYKLKK